MASIPDSTSKNFLDSGIRITLHEAILRQRTMKLDSVLFICQNHWFFKILQCFSLQLLQNSLDLENSASSVCKPKVSSISVDEESAVFTRFHFKLPGKHGSHHRIWILGRCVKTCCETMTPDIQLYSRGKVNMFQLLRHGVDSFLLSVKSSCFSLKYFASLFEVMWSAAFKPCFCCFCPFA